jgi:hypothetical protein
MALSIVPMLMCASHAVEAFLDAGFPVRGTVRSDDKGEFLKNLFKDKKQKFEYVIVKDIGEVSITSNKVIQV